MCGELGYAAAYVHSFCMLYCVEWDVVMWAGRWTQRHIEKEMGWITKIVDKNF
jgi:hypothetical protein